MKSFDTTLRLTAVAILWGLEFPLRSTLVGLSIVAGLAILTLSLSIGALKELSDTVRQRALMPVSDHPFPPTTANHRGLVNR